MIGQIRDVGYQIRDLIVNEINNVTMIESINDIA